MSETLRDAELVLSIAKQQSFHDAIKERVSVYTKILHIQDQIDENRRRFTCIIILETPLPTAQEEEIQGEILQLIQTTILPALSPGCQSTIGDITFVVQDNSRNRKSEVSPEKDKSTLNIDQSSGESEKPQRPYRQIIDMYPDDIARVQAFQNQQSRVLKLRITLNQALTGPKLNDMKQAITRFVTDTILPTMSRFSFSQKNISFSYVKEKDIDEDQRVEDACVRANAAFAGVDVPSGPGLFSGLGISVAQILEMLSRRLLPPR